ncbi:hybrid sensor histidine kinase/response regulator [Bdellovibrio sp. qaytius]|nr:hybrid sensor histidine kinase/response regulator [Bdellovibrio sp. qaytius]
MGFKKLWLNFSVQKKLFSIVGIMAVLVALELFTLIFAMNTLSAVRAYVGGEGVWSKGQKTAVYNLQQYLFTKNPINYEKFKKALEIPQGDRDVRIELLKDKYDKEIVDKGYAHGEIHESDRAEMIHLVRRFQNVPIMAKTLKSWSDGDVQIAALVVLGQQIKNEMSTGISSSRQKFYTSEINRLDDELSRLEKEFSSTLGEASRLLEDVLMCILILAIVIVESTGLYLTFRFGRSLAKILRELNAAAIRVGEGDYTQRVEVRSNDELGQLSQSLNRMVEHLESQTLERQHAEQASQAKNLFLANMSHEIRTPLNAILGFSEILQDQHLAEKDKQRYAAIIRRTGESLNTIINDILDISKIEADRLESQEAAFSLTQMLSDLYALLKMRCDEKGIQLIFERIGHVSEYIVSDQTRLRQILTNLVGNSIKFTEKGHVMLTYEIRGDMLFFTVSDTGAGISREQRANLFKVFSQGDSSVRKKYGGTGLGLSISQKLSQLLGGDAGLLDSEEGLGSLFYVQVKYTPVEKPISEEVPVQTVINTNLIANRNILVVEDSLDNQMLIEFYLTKHKANVVFANNGQEGVDAAMKGNFDLILMDIQMPILDGYAATEELRQRGVAIPIIALTGYAMKEDQDRCLKAGCNEFLAKPIHKDKLLLTLTKYFHTNKPNERPLDFI